MFEYIMAEIRADADKTADARCESIKRENDPHDENLHTWSTPGNNDKYRSGEITREKAEKLAEKRIRHIADSECRKAEKRLRQIESAPIPDGVKISVSWSAAGNPSAEAISYGKEEIRTRGYAYGGNYDKSGAAIGSALNDNLGIMHALYAYKNAQLAKGVSDESRTAVSGRDNRNIIAYGAGYGAEPYFEGATGTLCIADVLDAIGYDMHIETNAGGGDDYYEITRRSDA